MQKWRLIVVTLSITLLCTYFSFLIYPGTNSFGAIKFTIDRQQIIVQAKNLASRYEIDLKNYHPDIKLLNDDKLIRKIQEKFGLEKGNEFLREIVPGFWWDLNWKKKEDLKIDFGSEEGKTSEKSSSSGNEIHFKYDTHGKLISFNAILSDSLKLNRITNFEARNVVDDFVIRHAPQIDLSQATLVDNKVSVDPSLERGDVERKTAGRAGLDLPRSFDFKWVKMNEEVDEDIEISATVTKGQVIKFDIAYVLEEEDQADEMYAGLLLALFMVVIAASILVLAFRKSRAFEIRFRLALILGFIILVLYTIEMFFLVSRSEEWQVLLLIMLGPLFVSGAFVVIWAVGESVGRETWSDKFIPLDLLVKGHLFHSKLGEGILRGFMLGALAFFIFLGMTWVFSKLTTLAAFTTSEYIQDVFASTNPALFILSHSFWSDMYVLSINFILIASLIYKKTGKVQLTIILSSLPLAIMVAGQIQPLYWGLFIKAIALSVLLWGFIRYDLLTAFISLMVYRVLDVALSYAWSTEIFLQNSWAILILIFGIICVYALVTIFTQDRVTDFSEIEPALSKYINERQHMQQELKIARDVQMSFLPAHIPIIPGLDIASQCIPALNVGGDYFDFVKIAQKKIGVVIGDVSGKGTRAAFYMTLVKGFLKALSRTVNSPAALLKELNTLFFENAKRDAFISMAYGVFDTEHKSLVLARSGHNPVVIYKKQIGEIRVIKTEGLALGLEKGALFNKMMQEVSIELEDGDIILFYTDGLTEARNKINDEFGEEKLQQCLINNAPYSAEEILQALFSDVKKFSRGHVQHDDMSAVVVKVV